jgi:ABC-type dipeptide/oligopeptide/nickel transport system permease component
MARYIGRRILATLPTLLIVYTVVFFIAHGTPGSPWDIGTNRPLDPQVKANLDAKYHLNYPLPKQYVAYLWSAMHGDFGPSYRERALTVDDLVREFLPVSLEIGACAMAVAVAFGLVLGGLAALHRGSWLDSTITLASTAGISLPTYAFVSILIVVLGVRLRVVPTFGWNGLLSPTVIVPVVSLALAPMAALARYFRSSMLEVAGMEYLRTARAKGLGGFAIVSRHMARNAMIPVLTVAAVYAANIMVGSFFVESIAGIPGFGRYFVLAVQARDYPVIIGSTLIYAVFVVVMNLFVDIGYAVLDPRIRSEIRP